MKYGDSQGQPLYRDSHLIHCRPRPSVQYRSIEELAHAVKLDSSYVGCILRLTLLAPDIIMAILDGREPSGLSLGKLIKTLPSDWMEQRAVLGFPAV